MSKSVYERFEVRGYCPVYRCMCRWPALAPHLACGNCQGRLATKKGNYKRLRAYRVIQNMPIGEWISIRELARQAGLPTLEMCRYLTEVKKKGLVEHKHVKVPVGENGWRNTGLWRRKP